MVHVTLYFFDQNVIVTKSHTSWSEACTLIHQHITEKLDEYECDEEASLLCLDKQKIFSCLTNRISSFKDEKNPVIVCDLLVECLEGLEICKFDRKVTVGDRLLLRGVIENKNFLIEISEE